MDEATKQQYQREMSEIYQRTQAALLDAEKRIHAERDVEVLALRQQYNLPFFSTGEEL
jgi:hypothetical protein